MKTAAMFPAIRKRDGRLTPFELDKISSAILKALNACNIHDNKAADTLAEKVVDSLEKTLHGHIPQVEEIQDMVENVLIKEGYANVAKSYMLYREKRNNIREGKSIIMDAVEDILRQTSSEDSYIYNSPSAKMLKIASTASTNYYLSRLIPASYSKAHREGLLNIHDLDFYSKTFKAMELRLNKLLKDGFFSGYGFHRPPKRMNTVMALTAIILQASQNDSYGPQVFSFFDDDLAFIAKNYKDKEKDFLQAMEGFVYNLNTLYTRLGSHVPESCINLGLNTTKAGKLITTSLLKAIDKGLGNKETPLYPHVIFRIKKGVNSGAKDKNYSLFKLALDVASHRANPMFSFMDASFNKNHDNVVYFSNGDRITYNKDNPYGIGSLANVTINLPHIILGMKHIKKELSLENIYHQLHKAIKIASSILLHRFDLISNLKVKELPFIMGEKLFLGSEKLKWDDQIKPAFLNGTIAIGFIGLAEALILLNGKHHGESKESQDTGLKIVSKLNQLVEELNQTSPVKFVLSASSAENTSPRLARADMNMFGENELIHKNKAYSQSFHIPADCKISVKDKIKIEGMYHKLCPGGHFINITLKSKPKSLKTTENIINLMRENDIGLGIISYPIYECMKCGKSLATNSKCSCGSKLIRTLTRKEHTLLPLDRLSTEEKEYYEKRVPQT